MEKFNDYMFNLSENTKRSYLFQVDKFLCFLENKDINFLNLKIIHIQKYLDTISDSSPSTVRIAYYAIHKWMRYQGIKMEINKIKLPQLNNSLSPKILTEGQLSNFEKKIKSKQYLVIFKLLKFLGLRRCEIYNLRYSDVNIENQLIHIHKTKGNKTRTLPLNNEIIDAIKEYKWEEEKINTTERYFSNINNILVINQYFKKIDPSCNIHMFRHTCITKLFEKNIDIITIQSISGHANLETLKIYYRPSLATVKKALNKIQ